MKTPTLKNKKNRFQTSSLPNIARPGEVKVGEILVPIDFSEASTKALEYATSLAAQFGGRLTLLNVVEPVYYPDLAYTPLLMENDKIVQAAERELSAVVARNGIPETLLRKTLVRTGKAFHEITEAARTLKVDLIIIATHGRSGITRALLGSTTERVVRHAKCPVLVVRA